MAQGWVKMHRQIVESDIYQLPPLYLRLFERLIIEANHEDVEIPFKAYGAKTVGKKLIARGERLTSIRSMAEWVGWYEHGTFKTPNPRAIKSILDWLVENDMIFIYETQSNRGGTHYKVLNYDIYQSEDGEEVTVRQQSDNSQTTVRQQSLHLNKNDLRMIKNDKERDLSGGQNPANKHRGFEEIISAWNELGLTKVKAINPKTERHKHLSARIKEYGHDEILNAIGEIKQSAFLRGKNKRRWTIMFDWFVRPSNFLKVWEGTYRDQSEEKETPQRGNEIDEQIKHLYG